MYTLSSIPSMNSQTFSVVVVTVVVVPVLVGMVVLVVDLVVTVVPVVVADVVVGSGVTDEVVEEVGGVVVPVPDVVLVPTVVLSVPSVVVPGVVVPVVVVPVVLSVPGVVVPVVVVPVVVVPVVVVPVVLSVPGVVVPGVVVPGVVVAVVLSVPGVVVPGVVVPVVVVPGVVVAGVVVPGVAVPVVVEVDGMPEVVDVLVEELEVEPSEQYVMSRVTLSATRSVSISETTTFVAVTCSGKFSTLPSTWYVSSAPSRVVMVTVNLSTFSVKYTALTSSPRPLFERSTSMRSVELTGNPLPFPFPMSSFLSSVVDERSDIRVMSSASRSNGVSEPSSQTSAAGVVVTGVVVPVVVVPVVVVD